MNPELSQSKDITATRCVVGRMRGVRSHRQAQRLQARLERLDGVSAQVATGIGLLRIHFDPARCSLEQLRRTLNTYCDDIVLDGLRPCPHTSDQGTTAAQEIAGTTMPPGANWRGELRPLGEPVLVGMGGLLLLCGFIVHLAGGPFWLFAGLLALSAITSSTRTLPAAWRALRQVQPDIDLLMFVAATGACLLGHFTEAAFLLWLFGVGHAGEHLALRRARQAIESLSALAPQQAERLKSDGTFESVSVQTLQPGDTVRVRPFAAIPADGTILEGSSLINQAPITGESQPVAREPGQHVYAGTLNGESILSIEVQSHASETTLARVIQLVQEAQAGRSPTQQLTERIERYYVPWVLVATVLAIVLPPLLFGQEWGTWFYRAMAFLTAASPCALAIGTPAAVLCGVARAAQIGAIIKGGGFLEAIGQCDAVAFDKTGTLTRGAPQVSEVVTAASTTCDVLALAAALEAQASHPLARAIVAHAHATGCVPPPVGPVRQVAGYGVEAMLEGQRVRVSHLRDLTPDAPAWALQARQTMEAQGATSVGVFVDEAMVGMIALHDPLRPQAAEVLGQLRHLGMRHMVMLTGDHRAAAEAVTGDLDLDAIHTDLLPEDKLRCLAELQGAWRVMMVGDGVNDAPALAQAPIGVAMGGVDAQVAMETADVVLMGSQLAQLPRVIRLSRLSRRIIFQNLVLALGTIAVVSPLALLGMASLGMAVLLHEGSTVLVVLNALRLLRFDRQSTGQQPLPCPACDHCPLASRPLGKATR